MNTKGHINSRVLSVFVLAAVIVIGGCIQQTTSSQPKPQYSDVEISDFKWSACDKEGDDTCYQPPIVNSIDDGLEGSGNLVLYSSKQYVYAMVYANGNPVYDFNSVLKTGENKLHAYNIKLGSLYNDVNFKVCFSQEPKFTESSDNVICKEKSFPAPKISVSVSPNPLRMTVYKNGTDVPRSEVTVTNTGSVPMYVFALLPSYAVESLNYQKSNPQYATFGFSGIPLHFPNSADKNTHAVLAAGESAKLDVGVLTGNVGEYDTPLGTYTATGYIWSFSNEFNKALFKQDFALITEVK